ncbi:MAG: hypothetical protein P4L43_10610 [Syntrophobacteraceae bacterium]|nr:hypothetical protein [Syntrophobacteraceae bacterium]
MPKEYPGKPGERKPPAAAAGKTGDPPESVPVVLRINGKEHRLSIDTRTTLLDCLRETIHLTAQRRGAITDNAARARCT